MGCCSKPSTGAQEAPPSEQERALSEIGAKQHNRFTSTFVPAQAEYLDRTKATEADRLRLGNQVGGAVAAQTAGKAMDTGMVGQGLAAGIAPKSGSTVLGVDDMSRGYASSLAGGLAGIRPKQLEREIGGVRKITSIGQGLSDSSTAGMASVGAQAIKDAATSAEAAFAKYKSQQELRQGIVSGVAAAAGGLGRAYFQPTPQAGYTSSPTAMSYRPGYNPQWYLG